MAVAGGAGVIVGMASLRVREDFLAITTMGVGFFSWASCASRKASWAASWASAPSPSFGLGKVEFFIMVLILAALTAAFQPIPQALLDGIRL
jgi:branched-chain amino acid transport system permease protein